MKRSLPSLLCALVLGLVGAPALSLADYQRADVALGKLESIVTLTPAQKDQALQIFQNLKDVMDSMDPAERPAKGAQSRQDAIAAIRAILTPDQQAVYDRTPQRLGGGAKGLDPAMRALHQKITNFVTAAARTSPDISAQVGAVQTATVAASGSTMRASGASSDPMLHPDSGSNLVNVTGSSGTKTFKISWTMGDDGEMTVAKVEGAAN
jgi:hypothetical protein